MPFEGGRSAVQLGVKGTEMGEIDQHSGECQENWRSKE